MEMVHGMPRRCRLECLTPIEKALQNITIQIEQEGAHPLLTDAVVLIEQARDKMADFVELPKEKPLPPQG